MPSAVREPLSPLETLRGMRGWNLSAGLAAVYLAIAFGTVSTGFALALGASNALVGMLSGAQSWGHLLQFVSPLFSQRIVHRKPLCVLTYGLGYSQWLLVAVLPWTLPRAAQPYAMIVLVMLSGALIAVASPISNTWLTDLVPQEVRGRWVARNQSIMAGVAMVASLAAGRWLDTFDAVHKIHGFQILFFIAVAFALASIYVWWHVPEPARMVPREETTSWELLLLPFRHANFRNFTLFIALRTGSVFIAAPFFAVYMIDHLKIPYQWIALYGMCVTLTQIASNPLWGYLADKYGHKPMLRISTFGTALIPVPWFFTTRDNYYWLIPLVQLWAGFMAAGLILSQYNLMLKTAPEEHKEVYIGAHNATVNAAVGLGALLGGFLGDLLKHWGPFVFLGRDITHLHVLFLVSALCRFLGLSLLLRVREEPEIAAMRVMREVGSHSPVRTLWHLRRLQSSPDALTRASSTRALGETGSALPLVELIAALDDSDREVRRQAAHALGQIGDVRAVAALSAKADDPVADIADEAIAALGQIHVDESWVELQRLLGSERTPLRRAAALALGDLGDVRAVELLAETSGRERDPAVFLALLESLARLGGTAAVHRLRPLLARLSPEPARRQIANCIGHLLGGAGEFYRLLEAPSMAQEERVARLLDHARRLLVRWRTARRDERNFFAARLEAALVAFGRQEYLGTLACLRRVAGHALACFAQERGTAVTELLAADAGLRLNFGLLRGLERDGGDTCRREQALLGIFAFGQVIGALRRLGRTGR